MGAFAEGNSDPLKQIRPPAVALRSAKATAVTMNTPLSRRHAWLTSDGGRCNLRGVVKITPPKWARSVSYHMEAEKSTLFSLNIGDSLANNAWGKGRWEGGSKERWGKEGRHKVGVREEVREGGREGEGGRGREGGSYKGWREGGR